MKNGVLKYYIIILLLIIPLFSFRLCENLFKKKCEDCSGGTIICEKCNGRGLKLCYMCDEDGNGKCRRCLGTGTKINSEKCSNCDGYGVFVNPYNWNQTVDCSKCNGDGFFFYEENCYSCNSTGVCDYCSGDGLLSPRESCEECDGNKRIDCPNCKDGYIEK